MNNTDIDFVSYVIKAYGFLLPLKEEKTAKQFADIMRKYSSHEKTRILADSLDTSPYTFLRTHTGCIAV